MAELFGFDQLEEPAKTPRYSTSDIETHVMPSTSGSLATSPTVVDEQGWQKPPDWILPPDDESPDADFIASLQEQDLGQPSGPPELPVRKGRHDGKYKRLSK